MADAAALRAQLAYLERSSPFYRERLAGARALEDVPLLTKDDVRAAQAADPPFGADLGVPPEALVRLHVTSGTTGEPVAIGLTEADHAANCAIGGEAFRIAGVRPADTIAHCLNYALYAGGIADHMALEASGATVVPVGVGQSARLLDLIARLGITAITARSPFPHISRPGARGGDGPAELGLRHIVTAGEPGAGLGAVRAEIEATWAATVPDSFGMSDVWSTMAGECEEGEGLHLHDGRAMLEVVDPRPAPRRRPEDDAWRARLDPPAPRGVAPAALPLGRPRARVDVALRLRAQRLRIRIEGRVDDMLRVQAVNVHPRAIGAVLGRFDGLGRYVVVADGDPIVPPLRVFVETANGIEGVDAALRAELGARFEVQAVAPGTLPVGEQKTRVVYRTARGELPPPPTTHWT